MPARICIQCHTPHYGTRSRCVDCHRERSAAAYQRRRQLGTHRYPDKRKRPGRYGGSYAENRKQLLASGPACVYCGTKADTADHIVPVAKGGTHDLTNLVPACRSCNSARRDSMDVRWSSSWPTPKPPPSVN